MKRILTLMSILLTMFAMNLDANAAIITAISDGGSWNSITSWDLGRVPSCGDTIIVPSGVEIKLTDNVSLDDATPLCSAVRVSIAGRLKFSAGKKLRLAPGACMTVEPGGMIVPSAKGGGASESVIIDDVKVWQSSDGALHGEATMGCMVVLPVTLIDFSVSYESNIFALNWDVKSENELAYYEVFVSATGHTWELIHMQMARGNSSEELHYGFNYLMNDVTRNYVYFKLSATNFNGTKQLLAINTTPFEFKVEENAGVVMLPNPSQQNSLTVVAFELEQDEEYEITAVDNFGKVVVSNIQKGNKGTNTYVIENDRLKAGIYTIQVKDNHKTTSAKLIVL